MEKPKVRLRWLTAVELDQVLQKRRNAASVVDNHGIRSAFITAQEVERLKLFEGRDLSPTEIAGIDHGINGYCDVDAWNVRIPTWCITYKHRPSYVTRVMTKDQLRTKFGEDWRFAACESGSCNGYVFRPSFDAALGRLVTEDSLLDTSTAYVGGSSVLVSINNDTLHIPVPLRFLIKDFS